jgi:hypothetical protein
MMFYNKIFQILKNSENKNGRGPIFFWSSAWFFQILQRERLPWVRSPLLVAQTDRLLCGWGMNKT